MTQTSYIFRYRALSEALYEALTEDAFYISMENSVSGSTAQRKDAMLRYYDYSLQEGRRHGDMLAPNGEAFGASIWSRPLDIELSKQVADEKKVFLRDYMGDASLAAYAQITAFMDRRTATVVSPDSWYLSIVGIAPAFQGQGLGATIIRPILDRTDALDCFTYLETFTPRNMRFYQRLGFKEAGGFDEPVTNSRYWVMIRKPQSLPEAG